MHKALLSLAISSTLACGVVRAAELDGRIELRAKAKGDAPPASELRNVVVYFEPASPVRATVLAAPAVVTTRDKEFLPRVVPITVGSAVRFPNEDSILHNVFSVSRANEFDLGLYRAGPGLEHRFTTPGVVRVFCNVHHSMVAYVVVLSTPFFTIPDAGGQFHLTGLPAGPGRLVVWHESAKPWTKNVVLPSGAAEDVLLEVSQRKVPEHRKKDGHSYFESDSDYPD